VAIFSVIDSVLLEPLPYEAPDRLVAVWEWNVPRDRRTNVANPGNVRDWRDRRTLAFALDGNPWAMHIAMVATFWTTTARLVRGEVIKLRELEFVEAARAIGLGAGRIIFRHIVPNTLPILLVQATITFVAAIKSEVILSFLGLGVQNSVSWGLMIAESTTEVLAGHYMNFIAASSFLFMLVMGFNLFADGLQDALDPKTGIHK